MPVESLGRLLGLVVVGAHSLLVDVDICIHSMHHAMCILWLGVLLFQEL